MTRDLRKSSASRRSRSSRLLHVLDAYARVVVLTHDNPDPDGIAAGWGLTHLIRERLCKATRLVAGGAVVRAENRRMCELLRPPLELIDELEVDDGTAVVLVDCTPAAANHLCGGCPGQPVAVIDHHQANGPAFRVAYRDIRPRVAASATIIAQYLRDQGIVPFTQLATALTYAIKSDTGPIHAGYARADQRAISWLGQFSNHSALADIENAPLSPQYYNDLALALLNTVVDDDAALCCLPLSHGPEIVGEVADLLIRCQDIERVLCAAVVGDDVLVSCRTSLKEVDASSLLQRTLRGLGHCGGHEHRAGGKIAGWAPDGQLTLSLQRELRGRWLAACGLDDVQGRRLVVHSAISDKL